MNTKIVKIIKEMTSLKLNICFKVGLLRNAIDYDSWWHEIWRSDFSKVLKWMQACELHTSYEVLTPPVHLSVQVSNVQMDKPHEMQSGTNVITMALASSSAYILVTQHEYVCITWTKLH